MQINPPHLGPIEVRVEVRGDKAQIWRSTHSLVARDALESSAPKLREMLGSHGFNQVSVDVSQRSFQDRSAQPQPYTTTWTPPEPVVSELRDVPIVGSPVRAARGALDGYA